MRINNWIKLLALAVVAVLISHSAGQTTPAANAPRPNVVIFLVDDLGSHDVGYRGGAIKTPSIDKLAQTGAKLEQFYVQPVCSPTRAALLTGRYPFRLGLQQGVIRPWAMYGLPLDERTLANGLRDAGYATAIVGKWHLGHVEPRYLPTQRGFDHQYGHYNGAIDYYTHLRDGVFDWHKNDKVNRDEGYSTHLIRDEAVRLIKDRDQSRPLFLYVPFNGVHSPHQVPDQYAQPYAQFEPRRRAYAGMLAAVDEAIGEVTKTIADQGLTKNTLILFSSDNGGPNPGKTTSNGPLRAGKGTVYEGGVRTCALATWPGVIPAGSTVNAPLHIVDWYPTLLKLAGAPLEQKHPLDGRDAWAAITAGAASPHEVIVINTTPTNGAIREGDWKLVVNGNAKGAAAEEEDRDPAATTSPAGFVKVELFNLAQDPGEKTDLSTQKPEITARLVERYRTIANEAVPPLLKPKPRDFKPPTVWGEQQ